MRKKMITRRLNYKLQRNQWVNNEIKEEIRKYLKTNDNENATELIYGVQQKQLQEGSS